MTPGHRVAGVQVELADLRRRHVDVVRARRGSCSRARAGSRSRRAAFRARPRRRSLPLFSARTRRISKMSSCLRMPVAPAMSSSLAILVRAADAHLLQRGEIDALDLFVGRGLAVGAVGGAPGVAARLVAVGFAPLAVATAAPLLLVPCWALAGSPACRSVFHSSSSPSPVSRRHQQHGCSQTRIRVLSSRGSADRSRELVNLGCLRGRAVRCSRQPAPGPRGPLSMAGCRASTSSSAAERSRRPVPLAPLGAAAAKYAWVSASNS